MTPPFAGGMFATIIISQDASVSVATMAMLAMVMQGFVGFPLVNFCIKKECGSILRDYQAGKLPDVSGSENPELSGQKKVNRLYTGRYENTFLVFV